MTIGSLILILHSRIGDYPVPLPRSENHKREIRKALLLWGAAVIVSMLITTVISPYLNQTITDRTLHEFILIPLLSILYIVLPLFVVLKENKWTARDLGITWVSKSKNVSIFAVLLGLATGSIAFVTGQTVIGIDLLPWGALLFVLRLFFRTELRGE